MVVFDEELSPAQGRNLEAELKVRIMDRTRTRERGILSVAIVGYTNAGKSSLLKALTKAPAHIEDRLFATLDTQSREVMLKAGAQDALDAQGAQRRVRFTDTVGFIRKLPHGLVASFRATLEEALDAGVLLHVVDVSHPDWEEQAAVVGEALDQAGLNGRRVVVALNKADKLDEADRTHRLRAAEERGWEAVLVSAVTGSGLSDLATAVTVAGAASSGRSA
jgi:GTP-binding protein HflX